MVDLVLAGDNAIVVGIVAAGLPRAQRSQVILIGIAAATLLRVAFAVVTSQILPDHRPDPRRRHPVAVGVLEAVARVASAEAG